MSITAEEHQAIMVPEVLTALKVKPDGVYIDATFGRGGHSKAILNQLGPNGQLWVMDRDPQAIAVARALAEMDTRVTVLHQSFAHLLNTCQEKGLVGKINGVLLDLGVSSPQLDNAERGFSFRLDGPLDMRMDPTTGISAAEWIKDAREDDIASILKNFGEERFHRRIARAIVEARAVAPITTTMQLANIVSKANPAWEKHKHPATRSFQAIRMHVNNELGELSNVLDQMLEVLADKGRMVIISFHSLEHSMVKQFIETHVQGDEYPRGLPILHSQLNQKLCKIGKKIKPSESEIHENPRSRSAILRVAERKMPMVGKEGTS